MKWPFVSRRAYELMEETLSRVIRERDEQCLRADRAMDSLVERFGIAPVSTPARAEQREEAKKVEEYLASFAYEDAGSGQISDEMLALGRDDGDAGPRPS